MVNLGLNGSDKKTEDYKTKFLNELEPGEEIEGEIHIGDIKKRILKNREVYEFFIILTDREAQEEWICGFITLYYPEKGNIYGEKEGRVYTLIDSLNHAINKAPRNVEDSYSVNFKVFRKNINEEVEKVKVKAVQSWKPGAKSVNLEVMYVELKRPEEDESSKIENLSKTNEPVKLAYKGLKNKQKDISKKSVAFELKSFLDKEIITKSEFKAALKELDKL
jgi:hypothetical protein